jgi:hypothetical protein
MRSRTLRQALCLSIRRREILVKALVPLLSNVDDDAGKQENENQLADLREFAAAEISRSAIVLGFSALQPAAGAAFLLRRH